jgi:hypothetical protein
MSSHEMSYLEQRAESQLELARRATHPAAVRAHYQLAEMYLDKLYGDDPNAVAESPRS